jgi:hypothetical protein
MKEMTMSLEKLLVVGLALVTGAAFAQADPGFSPPPLVPAPPPMPPPEPPTPAVPPPTQPGTPPPPATVPPPGYQPSYAPYGQPPPTQKPGPEVGLMVSEALFGMLTAGGITVLPYFLLFSNGVFYDATVSSIMLILIFSAVPLAVAQTQVSLANGSRYYIAETWPAALAGLAAQAGVLGLFYATGWIAPPTVSGGTPKGGSVPLLLIGSIVAVPLIQMAVLNFTKTPRFKPYVWGDRPGHRLELGFPSASPIVAETRAGRSIGVNLSLLNGTF